MHHNAGIVEYCPVPGLETFDADRIDPPFVQFIDNCLGNCSDMSIDIPFCYENIICDAR